MNRVKLVGALAATAILTGSLPLLAEPLTWPWKDKTPSDPALVQPLERRGRDRQPSASPTRRP